MVTIATVVTGEAAQTEAINPPTLRNMLQAARVQAPRSLKNFPRLVCRSWLRLGHIRQNCLCLRSKEERDMMPEEEG